MTRGYHGLLQTTPGMRTPTCVSASLHRPRTIYEQDLRTTSRTDAKKGTLRVRGADARGSVDMGRDQRLHRADGDHDDDHDDDDDDHHSVRLLR